MITIIILVLILLLVGGVAYYLKRTGEIERDPYSISSLDEVVALTDAKGEPISFESFEGGVVVVNVWASWSPFSMTELPALNELARSYEGGEVKFVGINRAEQPLQTESFLKMLPPLDRVELLYDPSDTLYRSADGFAMPETIVYNERGIIVAHIRGPVNVEELKGYIAQALDASN